MLNPIEITTNALKAKYTWYQFMLVLVDGEELSDRKLMIELLNNKKNVVPCSWKAHRAKFDYIEVQNFHAGVTDELML